MYFHRSASLLQERITKREQEHNNIITNCQAIFSLAVNMSTANENIAQQFMWLLLCKQMEQNRDLPKTAKGHPTAFELYLHVELPTMR